MSDDRRKGAWGERRTDGVSSIILAWGNTKRYFHVEWGRSPLPPRTWKGIYNLQHPEIRELDSFMSSAHFSNQKREVLRSSMTIALMRRLLGEGETQIFSGGKTYVGSDSETSWKPQTESERAPRGWMIWPHKEGCLLGWLWSLGSCLCRGFGTLVSSSHAFASQEHTQAKEGGGYLQGGCQSGLVHSLMQNTGISGANLTWSIEVVIMREFKWLVKLKVVIFFDPYCIHGVL